MGCDRDENGDVGLSTLSDAVCDRRHMSSPGATPDTTNQSSPQIASTPTAGRRVGYTIAVAVNAVMLVIAANILEWSWFPWLTEEWNDVVPLVSFSLLAGIVVNVVYLWFDPAWFKSLTQAVLAGISLVVTVRVFQVFPFDFSAYEFGWETLTRAILIFIMIGITIGLIAETVKFIIAVTRRS